MRKIDDNLLLQMIGQGHSQAEIARFFQVSAVAVHKRLKRLIARPASLERLTPKEQKFAIAVAEGNSRISACMEAFDVSSRQSAKAMQNALMQKDDIQIAIKDLMQVFGLTRGYRIHKLKNHVDSHDPVVSLKALDLSWRLDNSFNDNREADKYPTTITLLIVSQNDAKEQVELTDLSGENTGSGN